MTHRQHPLGTGFTASSTAADVLRGIDLTGKNVIVTGGHAGLGLGVTRALAGAGASVTVGARDVDRATRAVTGIAGVEVSALDLADPASIAAFVARWLDSGRPLHVLINNATAAVSPQIVRDARGYELQFATGHLGHFQLTVGLHPALRAAAGARVVNVSSGAQRFGEIRWDDPNFATGYSSMAAYGQVKKANVLFAVELDRRWKAEKIRGYAVHPGVIIHKETSTPERLESLRSMGLVDDGGNPIIDPVRGKKTLAQGVSTIVFAATSPLLDEIGGVYLKDNDLSRIDDEPRPLTADSIPSEVSSSSIDPQAAGRLWELSERLLRA
jgi:NAD(P)-dependent dehydrogenase (short-subunit alcohol dehydrogenase family)